MTKFAFVFPGQGSQSVGMGKDLYENYQEAKNVFDNADEILGRSISKICFEGPEEDLKQTINTQPAILTTSLAALAVFKSKLNIEPAFVAGHSLGEYGALCEAGVLSFENAIKLIAKRAEVMSQIKGGAMAAVLGLDDKTVLNCLENANIPSGCATFYEECLKQMNEDSYVAVANYNCPGQVVITGDEKGIEKASEFLKEAGVKRIVPLVVSGAFHSLKMRSAADEFEKYLANFEINDAQIPVLTNVDAKVTFKAVDFREKMPKQIYSSVYWTQTIQKMIENGVDAFIEIGPGKVLAGLNKKISPEIKTYNVYDKASLDACMNGLSFN